MSPTKVANHDCHLQSTLHDLQKSGAKVLAVLQESQLTILVSDSRIVPTSWESLSQIYGLLSTYRIFIMNSRPGIHLHSILPFCLALRIMISFSILLSYTSQCPFGHNHPIAPQEAADQSAEATHLTADLAVVHRVVALLLVLLPSPPHVLRLQQSFVLRHQRLVLSHLHQRQSLPRERVGCQGNLGRRGRMEAMVTFRRLGWSRLRRRHRTTYQPWQISTGLVFQDPLLNLVRS